MQRASANIVSCHGVYGGPDPVKREALTMRDHVHSPPVLAPTIRQLYTLGLVSLESDDTDAGTDHKNL